jgi:hypothetical protein
MPLHSFRAAAVLLLPVLYSLDAALHALISTKQCARLCSNLLQLLAPQFNHGCVSQAVAAADAAVA